MSAAVARLPSSNNSAMISSSSSLQSSGQTSQSKPPKAKSGNLSVTILSAYDLPVREPPIYVRLTVCGQSAATGPPVQRHKDRNSFKFSNSSHQNELVLQAPLADLYASEALIEVCYESPPRNRLVAKYPLNQLKINETTWHILHLDDAPTRDTLEVGPTLRLQLSLEGPYRPEIAAVVGLAQSWFGVVDQASSASRAAIDKLPVHKLPDAKLLLIPAVPMVAVAVVSAPIIIGIMTIGLPLFLPIIVLAGIMALFAGALALAAYASTETGRMQLGGVLGPLAHTILSTSSGQRLVYNTGPRPSPVTVARTLTPEDIWSKLVVSLGIDLIGSSSYLIPLAGESFDLTWAPIQTILIMAMYNETSPNLKYISFAEEILPFTDIIPSATMGWLTEFGLPLLQDVAEKILGDDKPPMSNVVVETVKEE